MNSSSSSNRRPDRSVEPVAAPFPSMLHALTGVDGPDIMLVEGPAGAASPLAREELLELGARFGRHLTAVGVEPGDTVLIALPTGRALLGALFGAWCAGARVSLMPPTGPLGRRSGFWYERCLSSCQRLGAVRVACGLSGPHLLTGRWRARYLGRGVVSTGPGAFRVGFLRLVAGLRA